MLAIKIVSRYFVWIVNLNLFQWFAGGCCINIQLLIQFPHLHYQSKSVTIHIFSLVMRTHFSHIHIEFANVNLQFECFAFFDNFTAIRFLTFFGRVNCSWLRCVVYAFVVAVFFSSLSQCCRRAVCARKWILCITCYRSLSASTWVSQRA